MESKLQNLMICLSLTLLAVPACKGQEEISTDPSYYYKLCSTSRCGNMTLPYPFALPSFCHLPAQTPTCPGDGHLHLSSAQQTGSFRVIGNLIVDSRGAMPYVASDSLFGCGPISRPDYSYGQTSFSLPSNYTYGTHLNCTRHPSSADNGLQPASCLGCKDEGNVCYFYPGFVSFPECEPFYIFVPVGFNVSAEKDLRGYLQKGFPIKYSKDVQCQSCETSRGVCGSSPNGTYVCFCANSVHQTNCSDGIIEDLNAWVPHHGKSGSSKTLAIALSASMSAVILFVLGALAYIFAFKRHRKARHDSERLTEDKIVVHIRVIDLVDGISPTRYSYSQIRRFTNNFTSKLGEGGSGNVYKGIIKKNKSEMPVAVKVLKASKQSEKQFMNEIATVGRIHHNNLVGLLGYCVEGKKRAVVYELMENGSLDKFIYKSKKRTGGDEDSNFKCLNPKQMHGIALDTARGILYLHQDCRSRILHCDIKPHNVLLDSSFSAKVADFGLARMTDKERTHISLTVARGTPGYAAPEMWSKSYGPITDKSDVYSYGMLILEMAGGRKNYDSDAAAPSEVYFPDWVFEQVKNRNWGTEKELDRCEGNVEDNNGDREEEVIERMCLVGLWCIQHIPANRPSMAEVIQMLEGKTEIRTPPHPLPLEDMNGQSNDQETSTAYLSAVNESM